MLNGIVRRVEDEVAARRFERLARSHPLRYLFIEITRKCTLACVYCGSDCSPTWARPELGSDAWIDVLRQIAADFEARKVMLAFTGGEPLFKTGFFDVIGEAARLGFPFGMVSNGTLLTPQAAARLVKSGMGAISLSLDAPPDINDDLRGRGSAEKVAQAAANLHAAGYRGRLEIISTVTKPAVPHLDRLRRHIAALRVPEWRLAPLIPIGRAVKRKDLLPDANDLRAILDFIRRGRMDGCRPIPEFGEECYLGRAYERVVRPYRFQCLAGVTVGGIMSDGRIGACPELNECFLQGDVRHERFRDVWNERYRVFRDRRWTRRGACAACDAFAPCQGGSLHLYPSVDDEPLRCLYRMLGNGATD
ncbi:MAG: radical SAM protein [Vicinamibacteria bacterium]|nr:radical SAM protein [Vicinamibacteria bacterium]